MNIYVGNLPHELSAEELKAAFAEFGEVKSVNIVTDRLSGESRGFGFVEMSSEEEGKKAIEGMNDKELGGRALKVNEAHSKPKGRSGFGGGGGGGGGRGRSGGGPRGAGGGGGFGGSRGGPRRSGPGGGGGSRSGGPRGGGSRGGGDRGRSR